MLTTLVSITILGFLSQTRAQRDDIGLFDGRLVGIENIHLPAHADLRTFLGINPVVTGGIPNVGLTAVAPIAGRRLKRCQKKDSCGERKISDQCKYTPILTDLSGKYCRGCDQDVCLDLDLLGRGRNGINGRSGRNGGRRGINGRSGRDGRNGRRQEEKEERKRLRKVRRRICRTTNVCLGDSQREIMQGQIKRTLLGGGRGAGGGLGNQSPILGNGVIGNRSPILGNGVIGNRSPILGNGVPILGNGVLGNRSPILGNGVPILGNGVLGNRSPILGNGVLGNRPSILGGGVLGNMSPILGGGILGGQGPARGGFLPGQGPIMTEGIRGIQTSLLGGGVQPVLGGLLGNIIGQPQMPTITG